MISGEATRSTNKDINFITETAEKAENKHINLKVKMLADVEPLQCKFKFKYTVICMNAEINQVMASQVEFVVIAQD